MFVEPVITPITTPSVAPTTFKRTLSSLLRCEWSCSWSPMWGTELPQTRSTKWTPILTSVVVCVSPQNHQAGGLPHPPPPTLIGKLSNKPIWMQTMSKSCWHDPSHTPHDIKQTWSSGIHWMGRLLPTHKFQSPRRKLQANKYQSMPKPPRIQLRRP